MDDLLPHYERELTLLRQHARQFSERYPKIAGRLQISGENVEDPHVERLIESFALLAARVHKKLDDEYPEFTSALLQVLYPHYLRPFPACSIAHMDVGQSVAQLTAAIEIPRGTVLSTKPIRGVQCKFRTSYPVWVAPLSIKRVHYENVVRAPDKTQLSSKASSVITLEIALLSEQASFKSLQLPKLRVFIDAESVLAAQIRKAIFYSRVGIMLEQREGAWQALPETCVSSVGFSDDEALLNFDARSAQAYRLLSEFFAFQEKFNFIDIDFSQLSSHLSDQSRSFKLHFILQSPLEAGLDERLLDQISTPHFKLQCTPVVNLFKQHADPIRLTHEQVEYPVVADHRRAYAYEVYSLDSVYKVVQTAQGESILEYRPFYSLKHGDKAGERRYWHLSRDEVVAEISPGFEYQIALVDGEFDSAAVQTETLSMELTCTNRDVPSQMPYGRSEGDLFLEGGTARSIKLLRKPTQTWRFKGGLGGQWKLISHLSLNHFSLTSMGGEVLREALSLYNITGSAQNTRMIEAVQEIKQVPSVTRVAGNPFPVFVRGMEIEIKLNEEGFVGTGVHLFAQVLDHFFGLYVHANSFTQLVFVSANTGEEILRCKPRNGQLNLV